ncbi:MAG: hypothetical protein ACUBOA_12550 [Candidatus Loosdrechtia sp.]|uniref:hypothetical protein n=1 Tax=Candidatus Loosdrechtia sp. TaxID=3101272 RepID=UPI003A75D134|nr:MAG: hypothetical protein QY305_11925 [Candidatus Jettenia sp. AMX2]
MKKFHITAIILSVITTVNISGCTTFSKKSVSQSTVVSFYKSEEYDNANVRRVLLLPFTVESGRDKVVDEITDAFFIELQRVSKFDTVVAREFRDIVSQQKDVWYRGLISAEAFLEAKKRYNVDAIICGTITQYRPYEPPVLGIKMGMISARSGNVIWSADAIFDSSKAEIIKLIKAYHKEYYQKMQSLYEWKIILLSMKRYAQFVAYQMLTTL